MRNQFRAAPQAGYRLPLSLTFTRSLPAYLSLSLPNLSTPPPLSAPSPPELIQSLLIIFLHLFVILHLIQTECTFFSFCVSPLQQPEGTDVCWSIMLGDSAQCCHTLEDMFSVIPEISGDTSKHCHIQYFMFVWKNHKATRWRCSRTLPLLQLSL